MPKVSTASSSPLAQYLIKEEDQKQIAEKNQELKNISGKFTDYLVALEDYSKIQKEDLENTEEQLEENPLEAIQDLLFDEEVPKIKKKSWLNWFKARSLKTLLNKFLNLLVAIKNLEKSYRLSPTSKMFIKKDSKSLQIIKKLLLQEKTRSLQTRQKQPTEQALFREKFLLVYLLEKMTQKALTASLDKISQEKTYKNSPDLPNIEPYFIQPHLERHLALQDTSLGSDLSDLLDLLLQEVLHNLVKEARKETLQELSNLLEKIETISPEEKSWTGYLNQAREIKASQDKNLIS
jgi:hypothetical protein